ncbi:unnamed protein product, partial [Meganyctiphanes norvegica]
NWEERVRSIFIACERGHFSGKGGVADLLIKYLLPGTIQDSHGRSLLHCAVSTKVVPSGEPLWQIADLKSLVNDHHCNVNARNFSGGTILHILVSSFEYTKDDICCYGGEKITVSEAWLKLVQGLLELECNPALADYNNKTPAMYVNDNTTLRQLLSQEIYLKPPTYTANKMKFITNAAKQGESSIVMMMTKTGMPYFGPSVCPLKQAMENNHRDTVMLLQSSGLSLLSSSNINTIKSKDLPAIFQALLRLEICNVLQEEMRKISLGNNSLQELLFYMQDTQQKVKDGNIDFIFSSIDTKDNNSKNKDLLIQAASLGLTYTCRLLKLSDIFINYHHSHVHNPVLEALKNKHVHTATVLCVDLQIYYSMDSLDSHKQFQSSLTDIEMSVFKNILSSEDNISDSERKEIIEYLDNVKDNGESNSPEGRMLHLITKCGLVMLLHYIQTYTCFDLSDIIHSHINATILHVALIYEKANIIEYLSYMKTDFQTFILNDVSINTLLKIINNNTCQNIIERHLDISPSISSELSEEDVNILINRIKEEIDNISSESSHEKYKFEKDILIILKGKLYHNSNKPLVKENSINTSLDMDSVSLDKIVTQ